MLGTKVFLNGAAYCFVPRPMLSSLVLYHQKCLYFKVFLNWSHSVCRDIGIVPCIIMPGK